MIYIIGAGISGAVLAERYSSLGKKVVVIEKRSHIGGNCYDFIDDSGILVPMYGPHFFHTEIDNVWKYVNQFSEWSQYEHRVLSSVDGDLVPVPINIETVNKIFNLTIKSENEMKDWLIENTSKIEEPKNSEDAAISRVGKVLYEKMFKNYTKKQWDHFPHELDPQIMNRIPVRTNFEDRYFTDKYQAMPKDGYNAMFKNMLTHPNIKIELNTDFKEIQNKIDDAEKIFYTGRIDHFFSDLAFEPLEYRSLTFKFETILKEWYQTVATINYPNEHEYTRITEPKHATRQKLKKTTIIKEYPTWDGEPYYPVLNEKNKLLYKRYEQEAKRLESSGVYFVGRLATFKYLNMDTAIADALTLFNQIEH